MKEEEKNESADLVESLPHPEKFLSFMKTEPIAALLPENEEDNSDVEASSELVEPIDKIIPRKTTKMPVEHERAQEIKS